MKPTTYAEILAFLADGGKTRKALRMTDGAPLYVADNSEEAEEYYVITPAGLTDVERYLSMTGNKRRRLRRSHRALSDRTEVKLEDWVLGGLKMACRYAKKSEECYVITPDGQERRVEDPHPSLCTWAIDAAPIQLIDVPRWMQRNALAGWLLKYPDDCVGCPCYSERQ